MYTQSLYYLMYNKGFSAEVHRTKELMYNYCRCTYLPKWQRPVVPGFSVALFFTHGLDLLQMLFDQMSQFLSAREQGSIQTYVTCGYAVLVWDSKENDDHEAFGNRDMLGFLPPSPESTTGVSGECQRRPVHPASEAAGTYPAAARRGPA